MTNQLDEKEFNQGLSLDFGLGNVSLSKEQTKGLCNFLSHTRALSKYKAKVLERALAKDKLKAIAIFRHLDRGFAGRVVKLILSLKLSPSERKLLLNVIKKILRSLKKDFYNEISLNDLMPIWNKLPNFLRHFLVALSVLKSEILHHLRLILEKDKSRVKKLNARSIVARNSLCRSYKEVRYELGRGFLPDYGISLHKRPCKSQQSYFYKKRKTNHSVKINRQSFKMKQKGDN
jgi:hypothetical protein